MMFAPSRGQVRQFFFDTWGKYRAGTALQGLETLALQVILLHPEYHAVLEAPERTAEKNYTPDMGQTNPFLHMSLHLAIEEQLSIDQPAGVRASFDAILHSRGDRHEAMHVALECLGEMLWRSQRDGTAPDPFSYLECLRRG
jgi:hypothetical protein